MKKEGTEGKKESRGQRKRKQGDEEVRNRREEGIKGTKKEKKRGEEGRNRREEGIKGTK
jgi:hypothetical protein